MLNKNCAFSVASRDPVTLPPPTFSVRDRSKVMAQAAKTLLDASNTSVATVEQRHMVACALNTHMASSPVLKVCGPETDTIVNGVRVESLARDMRSGGGRHARRIACLSCGTRLIWVPYLPQFMCFRRPNPAKQARVQLGLEAPELVPWQKVSYYEDKLLEVLEVTGKDRDTTLREIRAEALIVELPLMGGGKACLPVVKGEDKFVFLAGPEGHLPPTISEAASLIYKSRGKLWRKFFAMTAEAREKWRERKKELRNTRRERDRPWPMFPPDLAGLAALHAHTFHGDKWIKDSKAGSRG